MNKIREFREQLKVTQEELALKINVSQSAISHYESGRRDVDLITCRAITNFFVGLGMNISIDDVFPPKQKAANTR